MNRPTGNPLGVKTMTEYSAYDVAKLIHQKDAKNNVYVVANCDDPLSFYATGDLSSLLERLCTILEEEHEYDWEIDYYVQAAQKDYFELHIKNLTGRERIRKVAEVYSFSATPLDITGTIEPGLEECFKRLKENEEEELLG